MPQLLSGNQPQGFGPDMVEYVEMPSHNWKYSRSIRNIFIILTILCLVAEGLVLLSMRKYSPQGFAPASPISKPTGIYSAPIGQSHFFPDIERFEAIRDRILTDLGDIRDLQADALIPELRIMACTHSPSFSLFRTLPTVDVSRRTLSHRSPGTR